MLHNCPITKAYILQVETILWPNLGSLKGKTTRKISPRVLLNTCDDVPEIIGRHGNVTLDMDIMYINGITFIMTTSRSIHFGTAEII